MCAMTLDQLAIGKDAYIESVETPEVSLRKHILDMGLTPGVEVTMIKVAPMGDPMEIRVRGYELTIRKDDANTSTSQMFMTCILSQRKSEKKE